MNHGIIGYGQVGKAVGDLVSKVDPIFTRDLDHDDLGNKKIDVLHICFPFTKSFIETTVSAISELTPNLTVIHSTVKPGTTHTIHTHSKALVVHTPFLGVHPQKPKGQFIHGEGKTLADYFVKFPKMIGPTSKKSAAEAKKLFTRVGLTVEIFDSAKETELAKILSTTYYGWNIIFEKWVHQVCENEKVNFDQVYTRYNTAYNAGYEESLPHVHRPVLAHHQGPIGGHCVIPNAQIIQDWLGDEFTQFIIEQNNKLAGS